MTIPQNMKNWTTTMDTKHDANRHKSYMSHQKAVPYGDK